MNPRALVILHPGVEEMEAVAPIDLLSRAGVEVIQAAVGSNIEVLGRSGIKLLADSRLHEVIGQDFDAIILPGGPGIGELRQDPDICDLLKHQYESGRIIACICAAPLLLRDAGLITKLPEYTSHASTEAELPDRNTQTVALSGNVITSQGAGTATRFSLKIVEQLCGRSEADKIAADIGYPHLI
ncbi:MAG: DJ-1 family glyoxalase III [Opitutales bacterium]